MSDRSSYWYGRPSNREDRMLCLWLTRAEADAIVFALGHAALPSAGLQDAALTVVGKLDVALEDLAAGK